MPDYIPTSQPYTFIRAMHGKHAIVHNARVSTHADVCDYVVSFTGGYDRCREIVAVCDAIGWNCETAETISADHVNVCTGNAEANLYYCADGLRKQFDADKTLWLQYYNDVITWDMVRGTDNPCAHLPYMGSVADALGMTFDDASREIRQAIGTRADELFEDFRAHVKTVSTHTYADGLTIREDNRGFTISVNNERYTCLDTAERALFNNAISYNIWPIN